jgi:RHS repeat-associated protein
MTCRYENGVRYNQVFDAENRLVKVQQLKSGQACPTANIPAADANVNATTTFYYDGNGTLVMRQDSETSFTMYLFGGMYEVRSDGGTTLYYPAGGAMRVTGTGAGLFFVLSDHLGSTSVVTTAAGAVLSTTGYYPFGETRYTTGSLNTDHQYTGQQNVAGIGLYNYRARFYDAGLGRFISADSVTPGGPQGLNRYSYTRNNPVSRIDPSGHTDCSGITDPHARAGCEASNHTNIPLPPPPPPNLCLIDPGLSGCNNPAQMPSTLPSIGSTNCNFYPNAGGCQSTNSSTGTRGTVLPDDALLRIAKGILGVNLMGWGLEMMSLGSDIAGLSLLELGGEEVATPFEGPFALIINPLVTAHAGVGFAIGGLMMVTGIGVTTLGAGLLYDAIIGKNRTQEIIRSFFKR